MAADTLTYIPSYSGIVGSKTPRILSAAFGDGYEQRIADGINSNPDTWELTFENISDSDANNIDSFFSTQGGHAWFWWTPSGEATAKKFVCKKWSKSRITYGRSTVQATLTQVFDYGT